MANPSGTRTPSGDSDRIISPSEAFLPPTRPTSGRPTSENHRTKRMHAPPPAGVVTLAPQRIGRVLDRPFPGPAPCSFAGASHRSHLTRGEGPTKFGGSQHATDVVAGDDTGPGARMRHGLLEQPEDERSGDDPVAGAARPAEGRGRAEAGPARAAEGRAAAAGSDAEAEGAGGHPGPAERAAGQG